MTSTRGFAKPRREKRSAVARDPATTAAARESTADLRRPSQGPARIDQFGAVDQDHVGAPPAQAAEQPGGDGRGPLHVEAHVECVREAMPQEGAEAPAQGAPAIPAGPGFERESLRRDAAACPEGWRVPATTAESRSPGSSRAMRWE